MIFVGDDLFDVEMRDFSKLLVCPSNSHYLMKKSADLVLTSSSGYGCVQELYEILVNTKIIKSPSLQEVIDRDAKESVKY